MENEIEEAMSDTIQGAKDDKNDLDGKYITSKNKSIIRLRLVLTRKFDAGLTLTNQGSKYLIKFMNDSSANLTHLIA